MAWLKSLLALSIATAGPGAVAAPAETPAAGTATVGTSGTPPPSPLSARLDAVVDRALRDERIVGAVVLVAKDGRLVYRRAAGFIDREAGRPMPADAIFRLASVSKPIVTVAALRLVEQGKLRLDDPVTRWLPDFRPRLADGTAPTITVHQLLTHSAGLTMPGAEADAGPRIGPYHRAGISDGLDRSGITLDEEVRRLSGVPLSYPPGHAWAYSLAIDVLGAVVARAHHGTLQAAVADLVTEPLGMVDTAFSVHDSARVAVPYVDGHPRPVRMGDDTRLPLPEALGGHALRFAPRRAFDAAEFPSAGAGMVGTADDVLRLLELVRGGGGPWLRADTVARMTTDHVGSDARTQGPGWGFGYGGAVLDDPALAATPQARGTLQWGGVYGHAWFVDRANGWTVVALTNTTLEGMSGRFPAEIRDAVYATR